MPQELTRSPAAIVGRSKQPNSRACATARDWRAINRKTVIGSFTLELPSGLIIRDILLHEREGERWIQLPSKEWLAASGETRYSQLLEFRDDETKVSFRDLALTAVNKLLRGGAQ